MIGYLTLMIMSEKGLETLKAVNTKFPGIIECVVSSRDPNVENDYYREIFSYCQVKQLKFVDRFEFRESATPYTIAISWRWLIPSSNTTLIVFHDSLLPKYRGFSPLVSALINAERNIGVTAMFASEGYDRGDIIAQASSSVEYPIKIQTAINLVKKSYANLAINIVEHISANNRLPRTPQIEKDATYSLWRDDEDYAINWNWSSEYIQRFIDAVGYPYHGASTMVLGRKARIFDVTELGDVEIENRIAGKVIFLDQGKPVVVCGTGLIKIDRLVDAETKESLLPLERFRIRFQ